MSVTYCGGMSVVTFGVRLIPELKSPSSMSARSRLIMERWITSITSFWFKPILGLTQNIPSVFWTTYKPSVPISELLLFGTERVRQSLTRTERLLAITQYRTRTTVLATHLCSVRAQCSRTKSCGRCLVALLTIPPRVLSPVWFILPSQTIVWTCNSRSNL